MRLSRLVPAALVALGLAASGASAQRAVPEAAPVGPKVATAPRAMVSVANPLAVRAGVDILKKGGTAIDAAVAIQAVLGLTEPQSSGLGGGAFMVYYDAGSRKVTAYDGRETAPAGATPEMFLGPNGKPLSFFQAVVSGRATGVPGAVAMLYMAHKDRGRLAWKDLFGAATRLADDGFTVTPRLANAARLKFLPQPSQPDMKAYLTRADGELVQVGDTLKNPAYAATLRRLAAQGPDAILKGPTAEKIVARTHADPLPGTMTLADLANYRPRKTEALCRPYHAYVLCTPQLPSGGPGLQELMGILSYTDVAAHPGDADGWYAFAEASRLMYADRDYYLGDPAFVSVPLQGLLDPAYMKARAKLIGPTAAKGIKPGVPAGAPPLAPDQTQEPGGTSSFVVVDAAGDVLAMTTTVESVFGTGRMVDGFVLNNQLTDFSLAPRTASGRPIANAVAAGKRPRSSMAPSILLDRQGRFAMAVGSPGGNSIIAYVGKTLMGAVEWKLPLAEAVGLPNLIGRGERVGVESTLDPKIQAALKARGLNIVPGQGEESGLHGAMKVRDGVQGVADPRREGIAAGF